jgi:hypothetical protein
MHSQNGYSEKLALCVELFVVPQTQESDDRPSEENNNRRFVHCFRFFPVFFPLSIMASIFKLFRRLGTGPVKWLEGNSGICAAEAAAPDQSGSIDAGGAISGSVPIAEATVSS